MDGSRKYILLVLALASCVLALALSILTHITKWVTNGLNVVAVVLLISYWITRMRNR